MSRRFISVAFGLALAASTGLNAGAATSSAELVQALTGQAGASQALIAAAAVVDSSCGAGTGGAACLAALQALVAAVPAGLAPSLKAEVASLVSTTFTSRPDIAANPALGEQVATLSNNLQTVSGQSLQTAATTPGATPPTTPATTPATGSGAPTSGGGSSGGSGLATDGPASAGGAG